ncbi:MAG: enoyl-CoA hydratase/isomerase family protein [Proteobacteria bacterium]|nr:enoyl-CoA hydratase/isomerase family protein [Pseudomonadota bacterium]MBU2026961.1 enoyl-CoA hydratase/isomerase family protein [Pseudomonadota bacterium]MBU2234224.1 enoyl-CoA hydratase/isomerase family protein [Pseudomonadota bacterium]MBU4074219.1 enoyl-CoA hydratase/isomerase family protein [Pseudomonadota bacterium]
MEFKEIIYNKRDGIATITINRPEKYNACTPVTIYELSQAFTDAWVDTGVGVVVLTGAGDKAFCTGGDQTIRDKGGYGGTVAALPLEVGWQQVSLLIRTIPKPVIARVNGFAIGGGHVFQVVCDLSIASETAQFGQAGPRVGSFDPGYGTGDLARAVGMKKAKEIWYLCRRYTARQALEMGLVNAVVPPDKLDEEVEKWCRELLEKSPTALKMLKYAFHGETDGVVGITNLGVGGLGMYYETDESLEGKTAFIEKRKPDFSKFRGR